ncbi:autophagy-related 13 -like protein [Brachionus plicatilis]|uniref:Autophagy-related protein 13 n=1 Tax=Brachionus plicatilis TaxID=10195 RepID=A0A3M7PSB8_BRAPC|nr:autophagy-related 13 -like protein [Brachionus plicatilis]
MLASSPLNSSPTINGSPAGQFSLNNPITSAKFLSKHDREALLQYTKHFTRKAVQIIVQSRLGDKKPTKSRVYAHNTDWFNLSIKDLAQITNMTKLSLGNVESLFNSSPFCIEISLRTPENQTMILETWCILFNDQLVDASQKVCFSVYKKMSLVLRSLMCLTRSLPTYQLSRRQNSDTYVLLYRMYCGEPIVHHLGENYATAKVGTVGTPIGSIIVNVAYRTRLTMTPQNSQNSAEYCGIQIKDDHFTPNQLRSESPALTKKQSAAISISPSSPPYSDKSPRSFSDQNSLCKRSTSNLNTICETNLSKNTPKTQPIPMRSDSEGNNMQLKKYRDPDESSADEYNSSSIGSTPDTIYYFKLKSAAFVPSTSFNNNYFSSSFSNLSENDLPPFITLLSNDFGNMSTSDAKNAENFLAQSPPPPNNLVEYQQQKILPNRHLKMLNNEEHLASPCSLPNFKMLEYHNNNFNEAKSVLNQATDDFVFIESVSLFCFKVQIWTIF